MQLSKRCLRGRLSPQSDCRITLCILTRFERHSHGLIKFSRYLDVQLAKDTAIFKTINLLTRLVEIRKKILFQIGDPR